MPLVEVSWWDHLGKDEGGDAAVEIAQELVNAFTGENKAVESQELADWIKAVALTSTLGPIIMAGYL